MRIVLACVLFSCTFSLDQAPATFGLFRPDTAVTPASYSGLILWLEAASGISESGGKIASWTDKSSFAMNVSQSDSDRRFTKTASALLIEARRGRI